jgi:hypothetical protein
MTTALIIILCVLFIGFPVYMLRRKIRRERSSWGGPPAATSSTHPHDHPSVAPPPFRTENLGSGPSARSVPPRRTPPRASQTQMPAPPYDPNNLLDPANPLYWTAGPGAASAVEREETRHRHEEPRHDPKPTHHPEPHHRPHHDTGSSPSHTPTHHHHDHGGGFGGGFDGGGHHHHGG